MRRRLLVVAVEAEAEAVRPVLAAEDALCVAGIGRVNAAAATVEALVDAVHAGRPFDAALSVGVAGSLPVADPPAIGRTVVASGCVYAEEGLITPDGFEDVRGLGFPLGDFDGNAVPVASSILAALEGIGRTAPIATVATCSGTDAAATETARRTGAVAEAMEGAAVVHAARRLGARAGELRVISNTTGDRDRQRWDLETALHRLGPAVERALEALASA